MGIPLGIFNCKIDSKQNEFKTPIQLTLGGFPRNTQFTFRLINKDYHQGFSLWEIEQERKVDEVILVAFNNEGKTEYKRISEYIIPETLKAYYLPDEILLIEGSTIKRRYSYKLIKENFGNSISISEPVVNITELIKHVENVEKARIQRQSTSADKILLIGGSVAEDIIFDQLLEEGGQLKSVRISFLYGDTLHRLNISENGSLYLIGNYESVNIQLEVIKVFYEDYLKLNKLIG